MFVSQAAGCVSNQRVSSFTKSKSYSTDTLVASMDLKAQKVVSKMSSIIQNKQHTFQMPNHHCPKDHEGNCRKIKLRRGRDYCRVHQKVCSIHQEPYLNGETCGACRRTSRFRERGERARNSGDGELERVNRREKQKKNRRRRG